MGKRCLNSFGCLQKIALSGREYLFVSLEALANKLGIELNTYPHSWKIVMENLVRNEDGFFVTRDTLFRAVESFERRDGSSEVPFFPSRMILQDFTGVPAIVDLAAMRDVMAEWGMDPSLINPRIPVHLVIDHSLQVDVWGSDEAEEINLKKEFERNTERYQLLKWAQQSFSRFHVVPPGKGIIHQINLEHLATVVRKDLTDDGEMMFPDTVVGTDSHTTMINGLGVLGWGVGGIEAEAVILGLPYYFPVPEVVGVMLVGNLPSRSTATDVALLVTEELRKVGVVGKFVEFFGPAWRNMSLMDRATLANMAPEYGATIGFCPVDDETIRFLEQTGFRGIDAETVKKYLKAQHLFGDYENPERVKFSQVIEIDVAKAVPSLAGPKRPQDRIPLYEMHSAFPSILKRPRNQWGYELKEEDEQKSVRVRLENGAEVTLRHGTVVLAAITSCTNTANPALLITAALLARKARESGISAKPWVKKSFTPGSRTVTHYLEKLGLLDDLKAMGFHVCGYGCATCIGNSGPLPEEIERAIVNNGLVTCAVVSANRNFEGRIHGAIRANFLASPPLVVAYALAGRIDFDWENEPLGQDPETGEPIYLRNLWPAKTEVEALTVRAFNPEVFGKLRSTLYEGTLLWENLKVTASDRFPWDDGSTYLRRPSYLKSVPLVPPAVGDIENARVLLYLGDSVTTDHISPAGAIPEDSPAGRYLLEKGLSPRLFNSYGARRGNDEVMVRGTFANIRLKNRLCPERTGGWTIHFPTGELCTVWEASERYRAEGVPLIVIAGKEYGTGSSRDWAAKGTAMLGVRAVIAESFERIHRSNLIGMGVLPLQFPDGQSAEKLGLSGHEVFSIKGISPEMKPRCRLKVVARRPGKDLEFDVICRLDTPVEISYYIHGGILPRVLREMAKSEGKEFSNGE
ncbi:aconitate hydratase AcnA [Thermodesulforhabdus norvegica]|uniref:Aconitate hydratase n=1 Tax=Thermodesulforhabdus norvegica TaxID=39841 RepID=A0A1I4UNL0_9BACT|nr:aconitate hydratase AcnA [Thermodesulforhabdus norvegica]SFM90579.1 aconitate hydratase [Thermodesulforhabdus norvegica]